MDGKATQPIHYLRIPDKWVFAGADVWRARPVRYKIESMKRKSAITFLFATIFSGTLLFGNIEPARCAEADSASNKSPAELKKEEKEEKRLEMGKLKEAQKNAKEQEILELKSPMPAQTEKLENPSLTGGKVAAPKAVNKAKEEVKVEVKHETKSETKSVTTPANKPSGKHFSGNVSWYGPHFNGKKTASGEIFDMSKKTAAHRTLPFFTKVLVEDPKTGKTVVVKVNDRGPFVHSRVMDLSREGARQLGTLLHGTAYVDCMIVGGDAD